MRSASDDPDIRTLTSGVIYEDNWIRLHRDDIERRDGSRGTYAFVEKRDFALVIPAENGGFHLVEEYRYPVGRRTWSFPQGTFPDGADGDPELLARTELAEETGLRAGRLEHLGHLHCSHGTSGQGFNVFLATDLVAGEHAREHEEQDMRQRWFSRGEFWELVAAGRITDDSTLAAYALLMRHEG